MTIKDVTLDKSKRCSNCNKKMYHGSKVIEIRNDKGKVKANVCSDNCARKHIYG